MSDWYIATPTDVCVEGEIVRSAYLGNLFHYWQGRSAWYGLWSSRYRNEHSFHPDLSEIENRVEQDRTKGSQWTILEIPTVVFAGDAHALAVAEINTDKPFAEAKVGTLENPTLGGLADVLRSTRRDAIWQFFTAKGRIAPTAAPFHRYSSVSAGSYYTLGWNPTREAYDLKCARRLIDATRRRLKKLNGVAA